jgi:hypothetical protein
MLTARFSIGYRPLPQVHGVAVERFEQLANGMSLKRESNRTV